MFTEFAAFLRRFSLTTIVLLLGVLVAAASALAQRTETQNGGGGNKLEQHYNAAGQVTETRTIGPDGKLLEKDTLEYPPGALVPQSVSTSYWPNGQPHKITRNTYDNNSNFTGEFVEILDDTGKQIGGHRLTHDPQTNVYTCAEWNDAAHAYKGVDCPAGEESSGTPEAAKTFTADEVQQQLARAREPQRPSRRPTTAAASPGANVKEVGLVLPAHVRPGERVSGSVVEDPTDYDGSPEVMVTRFALPLAASGKAATLSGWQVEISGEPAQAADGPIVMTVPAGQSALAVLFRAADNAAAPVSKSVKLAGVTRASAAPDKAKASTPYLAPALCLKGRLCVVRGPFSGDSRKTFAAFETRPAKIVAETPDSAYLAIPDATEPGQRPLAMAEGAKAIAFPMAVGEFSLHPDRRNLPKGETLLMYATIEGAGDVPDSEWRPGNFPPSNLEEARKLLPGFQPAGSESAHDKHEAEERGEKEKRAAMKSGEKNNSEAKGESEENEGGEILLVVKNLTPDVANFRDSKNGTYVFHLNSDAFKMGDFSYKFLVEAKQTGNFGVQGWLIPFLAPVKGQEFPISATTSSK